MANPSPISYYGGKSNMVNSILPLFPNHQQYVEPFFGGGAVFFAKKPSPHEVINDTLDCAITFYRVLKTRFPELQSMIQATLHSESEYKRAKELLNSDDDLLKAWAFWVQSTMSFSHKLTHGFAFGMKSETANMGVNTKNKRDNFTDKYSKRLERIEIFCRDALEIIKLKDTPDTFFYIDPPYVSSDCGHYKGYTIDDFAQLLELLATIKGKFLLSSYPEQILMAFRENFGWSFQDKVDRVSVSGKGTKGKTKTECLTFNYEPEIMQGDLWDIAA